MLYSAYELAYAAVAAARSTAAALDLFENAMRRYPKPEWGISATYVNGVEIPVEIEAVAKKPFCTLTRFRRDDAALKRTKLYKTPDPKVLIVAPMSGHYATLLRGTVEAMLPGHDVYITDWTDARNAPLSVGRFDLNTFIDYLIDFMRIIGAPSATGRVHALAVCQPGPALLSAAAIMAETEDPFRPASITLMGSPIDTRRSPTVPNQLSKERPYEWFQNNMIYTVPAPYAGVMRRVYPGFVQLYSFLAMNSDRHLNAHYDYFTHLVEGDGDSAEKHRGFYDEYLSVMDMTEEFYLQTIREVFQEHSLAEGKFMHFGQRVKPEAITDIALMTVEGENDDISGIGQTQAAHDLCSSIPDNMKLDYIQPGVGHYGVFNGSRWRAEIQPKLAKFIAAHEKLAAKPGLALAAE
jgi:poly(3-hydroxybutyrate) depolymerase